MLKSLARLLLGTMLVGTAVLVPEVVAPTPAAASAGVHYVDCSAAGGGNGSQQSPWNSMATVSAHAFGPGDQVLFKRGTTCNGHVEFNGSGSASAPVLVSAYGTGALPRLVGDGLNTDTYATVVLRNEQYYDFTHLDISSAGSSSDLLRGIYIELNDYGTGNHYHFTNLNIHDVIGPRAWDDKANGGIVMQVTGTTVPTHYNDILVANNTFTKTDSFAFVHWTTWRERPEMPCVSDPCAAGKPWQPATNIVVRNNSLTDMGADGLHAHNSVGAVIEYNTVHGHMTRDPSHYHVAIWNWNADDSVIQFNEVSGGQSRLDGTAFDFDGGANRQIVQYNYSHDNQGGLLTICSHGISRDNVARYNISQNDGRGLWIVCGKALNTRVYNNTFYAKTPAHLPMEPIDNRNGSTAENVRLYNNIFSFDPSLAGQVNYNNADALAWNSNTFHGVHPATEPADPRKLTTDPGLSAPGTSPTGYNLVAGSTSRTSGVAIPNNGGRDYFGNSVPALCDPDRGAVQSSALTSQTCSSSLVVGGNATQSSTLNGASADRALDGDTDGNFSNGSVTHTNNAPIDANPWWQVDLGSSRPVGTIRIANRTDCCSSRLSNFNVFASATPFTSNDPAVTAEQPGVWRRHVAEQAPDLFTIPVGKEVRYIRVQLIGNANPLSLAEVEVFSNHALPGTATANAACNGNEAAAKAIDGAPGTKWCSPGNGGNHTLTVNLTGPRTVDGFNIRHAGSGGDPSNLNTRDFTIATTTDPTCAGGWTTRVTATGNTANVTKHSITPVSATCVRLNTTVPSTNDGAQAARIHEFEVYGS
ncbi:discoidin domain-containing protein [Streptomyces bobili]|uniref:discoidin domain-containing protein n=1 Tax=Streptomyces bobili TaxID=67280 RepID=UPI0034324DF2